MLEWLLGERQPSAERIKQVARTSEDYARSEGYREGLKEGMRIAELYKQDKIALLDVIEDAVSILKEGLSVNPHSRMHQILLDTLMKRETIRHVKKHEETLVKRKETDS